MLRGAHLRLKRLRAGAALGAFVLLGLIALDARTAEVPPPATAPATRSVPAVTARPPREAVPVPPVTTALQGRIHQCNVSAHTQNLHGAAREAFLHSCMAAHRTAAGKSATAGANSRSLTAGANSRSLTAGGTSRSAASHSSASVSARPRAQPGAATRSSSAAMMREGGSASSSSSSAPRPTS
jgi:hypothetical protein